MTSVCTGAFFSRCCVPVPVTTTSCRLSVRHTSFCAPAVPMAPSASNATVSLRFINLGFASYHAYPERACFCHSYGSQAGILTLPCLPCLPDLVSVALYGQACRMRITAAGTVPDSHRIPLHLSDVGRSIAIVPVRKNTLQMYNFFGIYCTIIRFFFNFAPKL